MFNKPLFSVVSSKGQTVLPIELRRKVNIGKGSTLFYTQLSDNSFMVRVLVEGETISPNLSSGKNKIPSFGLKKTY
ncbi:AbrB/MazE/SpoVT family DNA-binding domain-containing protein [Brevibacillus reuszeri]|uniref:AbrB/MazE/SpoVT family DNA-binding domain-containing protein n=1 Tax=Brevibacillus reuszeri TaxID=54915 RepID=UPI000CCC15C0